jgi:hypothetical protein
MATISTLIDRVRLELGDLGKSFVERLYADGTTNRFQLSYNPLDAVPLAVSIDGTPVADSQIHVEESTGIIALGTMVNGVITTPLIPTVGQELIVNGTHFRYFTNAEMTQIVENALGQHSAKRVDSLGRKITVENLAPIEEYPVALYAATLALYTLATDASFDIDISAPDGVMIPRSERYRQLMDMIQARREQYRDLCVQLGIGMYSIDVFTFRRISKTTNRYVPVYKPQEVDDKSVSQRAEIPLPTYGDANVPWVTEDGQLTSYQDVAFSADVTHTANMAGSSFVARLVTQRGSIQVVRNFDLEVSTTGTSQVNGWEIDVDNTQVVLYFTTVHSWVEDDVLVVTGLSDYVEEGGETIVLNGTYKVLAAPNDYSVVAEWVDTTNWVLPTAVYSTELSPEEFGDVELSESKLYTFTLSLSRDSTLRLPNSCWWQVLVTAPFQSESIEIIAGDFFSRKSYTAIL